MDAESESHVSDRAIRTYVAAMHKVASAGANFTADSGRQALPILACLTEPLAHLQVAREYRAKREASSDSQVGTNVVCKVVPHSLGEREDSNVIKDHSDADQLKECFEYKEFGSGWLKAFFNRSLLTGSNRGKPLDNFETKYKLGAQMWGETMFMGQIDISKSSDSSKLRINLFGSEYIDLNLCDIRDKVFSQANQIPLFAENIWV